MQDHSDTKSESVGRSGKGGSMKLIVLGATGGTGLEIVRLAIEHGHSVTAFGPRLPVPKADANLLRQFGGALTSAMPQAGVKRVVVESVAFLFKDSIIPPAYLFGRLLYPSVVADASAMEKLF